MKLNSKLMTRNGNTCIPQPQKIIKRYLVINIIWLTLIILELFLWLWYTSFQVNGSGLCSSILLRPIYLIIKIWKIKPFKESKYIESGTENLILLLDNVLMDIISMCSSIFLICLIMGLPIKSVYIDLVEREKN